MSASAVISSDRIAAPVARPTKAARLLVLELAVARSVVLSFASDAVCLAIEAMEALYDASSVSFASFNDNLALPLHRSVCLARLRLCFSSLA